MSPQLCGFARPSGGAFPEQGAVAEVEADGAAQLPHVRGFVPCRGFDGPGEDALSCGLYQAEHQVAVVHLHFPGQASG